MISPRDSLTALGLTALEAEAYAYLLTHSAATGYRVAKGIGKPTANTYKALATLHDKGAVTVGRDPRRLYRAVAPEELLSALEWRFLDSRRRAAEALADLRPPARDGRVYHLRSNQQAIQRLREMLSRSRATVVLALPAAAIPWVADVLPALVDRGSDWLIRSDGEPPGVDASVLVTAPPADATDLVAVVDRREFMMAGIEQRGGGTPNADGAVAVDAVWSSSGILARAIHRALVSDVFFSAVAHALAAGLGVDELEDTFARFATLREAPEVD